jgi:hypothetical protein
LQSVHLSDTSCVIADAQMSVMSGPELMTVMRGQGYLVPRPGGHVVIGTFALDGPERCSGLPIMRYDAGILGTILGTEFELMDSRRHDHTTPWGAVQRFQFSTFRRA